VFGLYSIGEAKVLCYRNENTAKEINFIFALTAFVAASPSAQNTPIVFAIRRMYLANSFHR